MSSPARRLAPPAPEEAYSADVRVGGWQERQALGCDQAALFLLRRQKDALLVHHSRALAARLMRPVALDHLGDHVMFGQTLQLRSPASSWPTNPVPPTPTNPLGRGASCVPTKLVLVGSMTVKDCDRLDELVPDCPVRCTRVEAPSARSAWTVCPSAGEAAADAASPLTFGQPFMLRSTHCSQRPLYVALRPPMLSVAMGGSGMQSLFLSASPSPDCLLAAEPADEWRAPELQGQPVWGRRLFYLRHVASGLHLSTAGRRGVRAFFLGAEMEVWGHAFRASGPCTWAFWGGADCPQVAEHDALAPEPSAGGDSASASPCG